MALDSIVNTSLKNLPTTQPPAPKNVLNLFSLKGKVASVTGSSTGIGLAVAESYAQAGADVAIWYNSTPADDKAQAISEKYGVKCKAYKCNVSEAKSVEDVIDQIEKDFGTIDIFVANAGVPWTVGEMIHAEDHKSWQKIIDLDFTGVYYCAKHVGKIFEKKGKGVLILTASMSGHIVNYPQKQAPYNAAKAAVIHLAKSLAVEWSHFARVVSISPGYISTNIGDFVSKEQKDVWLSHIPLGREGTPEELAATYVFIASDAASYVTGVDLIVDGGYTAP
ncbi:sorbose reductase Sou1p [[Candida] jaroonii]|uniref:Sorbose reductase Sou1p n=1 Tax=[Candida] jaroonii TaxID=467808 RepID=A0ACA9Y0Q1_9ASCO|nr:sorbose reductase Sou1p [[Candida] jaroonii]